MTLQDAFYRIEDNLGFELPKFGRGWKMNPDLAATFGMIADFVARNERDFGGPSAAESALNVEAGRMVMKVLEARA